MNRELNELTIYSAVAGLKEQKFTSVDLTKACIKRIKQVDSKIKAFLTLTESTALIQAENADKTIRKLGKKAWEKHPLLGIPYACKDNYSTKGIRTTASSKVLDNYIPPYESTVTLKLKEAGAVLLGKTNMDAFAHGSSTETSDYFKTANPFDLTRSPGGSSGGSAAAVASNMCIFAIGSETAGSIRGPASWSGVTGLKPTYGRVSRYGVVAMASSTDSPGPITKDVKDAALLLSIIAGKDQNDATSAPAKTEDYTSLTAKDLKGLRIGIPKSYFKLDLEKDVRAAVLNALEKFKSLGAELVEMDLIDPKYSIAVYTILQRSEVSSNLARLTGVRYGRDRSYFGFEAKKRMMLGAYTLSSGYYDAYYAKAQKVRTLLIEDMKKAFSKVAIIAAPTMPCVAIPLGESEKQPMFGEMSDVLAEQSSIAGICAISIPCGMSQGLPIGIQLMGNMFNEKTLLSAANIYQNSTKFHEEIYNLKL